ncbi:hypothetical protein ACNKHR_17075 [Shigella flexneri]
MPYKVTGAGSQGGQSPRPCAPPALANKIAAAPFPRLIPCGYRRRRKGTSRATPPRRHPGAARPASRERFGDFDATNTRAVFL